jgi:hypothetical protein
MGLGNLREKAKTAKTVETAKGPAAKSLARKKARAAKPAKG